MFLQSSKRAIAVSTGRTCFHPRVETGLHEHSHRGMVDQSLFKNLAERADLQLSSFRVGLHSKSLSLTLASFHLSQLCGGQTDDKQMGFVGGKRRYQLPGSQIQEALGWQCHSRLLLQFGRRHLTRVGPRLKS